MGVETGVLTGRCTGVDTGLLGGGVYFGSVWTGWVITGRVTGLVTSGCRITSGCLITGLSTFTGFTSGLGEETVRGGGVDSEPV